MINLQRSVAISVDVDSMSAHLSGYGIADPPDDDAAYRIAIPRALQLFESLGVRATFFLIAREAADQEDRVREIAAAGHEVASHSMTHRLPFDPTDESISGQEIEGSRALLESVSGLPVLGFRAPSWGVSRALLYALAKAGYRYDASSFPSWMLYLARLSVARRGEGGARTPLRAPVRQMFLERATPHVVENDAGSLVEIPVSTVPVLRVPLYHTLGFLLPGSAFRTLIAMVRQRRGPLTYAFHAVDFLDLYADGLDKRLERHPGMSLPLADKMTLSLEALVRLGRGREFHSLAALANVIATG